MRITAITEGAMTRAAGSALEGVRPAPKPSDSAPFGRKDNDAAASFARKQLRIEIETVCQEETMAHDPFWDGPRLVPAFVTQLLGQAMQTGERPKPSRAYAAAASPARLLDAKF